MEQAKVISGLVCLLTVCSTAFGSGCIVDSARSEIGVEEKGDNQGAQVTRYLNSTGLSGGYPWCAAFLNWLHVNCDQPSPEAKAAWSPAWFPDKRTVYQRGSVEGAPIRPGDVFGIYFRSKGRIAHVGLIESVKQDYLITIEGNTNEAGGREGQGVYRKRRPRRTIFKVSRWRSR